MSSYKIATPEALAEAVFDVYKETAINTSIYTTFATQYEVDNDGVFNEEDFYGAEILKRFDGYVLLISSLGGGTWYSYDVAGDGGTPPTLQYVTAALVSFLQGKSVALECSDER